MAGSSDVSRARTPAPRRATRVPAAVRDGNARSAARRGNMSPRSAEILRNNGGATPRGEGYYSRFQAPKKATKGKK